MMHHFPDFFLPLAAFLAGALNSVAGGGSFITFPTLVFYGVAPVMANASNTVALFPASFTASWAARKEFKSLSGVKPVPALAVSLVGGITGAWLLLKTPEANFVSLIPYLLLFAALVFTFGGKAVEHLKRRFQIPPLVVLAGIFLVAVYGGYFGGGIGILILALLTLSGMKDIHTMNALKSLLAGCLNGIAVVLFAATHLVDWHAALFMVQGAVAGGFMGATYSKKVSQPVLRKFISFVGFGMAAYFFIRR